MAHESWQRLVDQLSEIERRGPDNPRIYRGYLEPVAVFFRNLVLFEDVLDLNERLAHYTSWERAVAIMEGGDKAAIRMYNYEIANDPREGEICRPEWSEVETQAGWLDEVLAGEDIGSHGDVIAQGSAYGCSFSSGAKDTIGDDLNFWRLYGNDGDGCSFMVPVSRKGMYRVRYYGSEGRSDNESAGTDDVIIDLFAQLLQIGQRVVEGAPKNELPRVVNVVAKNLRRLRAAYRHLAKNHYYQNEREWRMVRIAPEPADIHFDITDDRLVKRYVNGLLWKDLLISGSAITIGPCVRNRPAAVAYMEDRKRRLGVAAEIVLSDKEYRSV